jgi:UDP-N-acetylglucosamine 2-epimerase (non-hydrolysing)
MKEERQILDRLSDLLFTPSEDADRNLAREGIDTARVRRVGNVMIDSLVRLLPAARACPVLRELGLPRGGFVLVTLHRPDNVDNPSALRDILDALGHVAAKLPVIFPVHPRTRKNLELLGLGQQTGGIRFTEPLGYIEFLGATEAARLVITDSGGIQEETTYLGVPCLTIRPNTERPVTVTGGTNRLVACNSEAIRTAWAECMEAPSRKACTVPLWDGGAAPRIVEAFLRQADGN